MKKSNLFLAIFLVMQSLFTASAHADSEVDNYQITATKLDKSRNNLSTKTGTSSYSFNQKDIKNSAMGSVTSVNNLLLQAPGVAKDSGGQLHIRNDHSNLQYRINGIIIPEAIGGFGQVLDTHFIDNVNLLTGALPAEYGYRTAGVVDIQTKKGSFENGGRSEFTVGSNNTVGGNQEFSGSSGKFNYYLTASYLQNDLGIESPTSSKNSIHNFTRQDKQFGYFSYLLSDTSRLNVIMGNATNRFEIPNNPNQTPTFDVNGNSKDNFNSANLDENQKEANQYGVVSLQGVLENGLDYQLALFSRRSNLKFKPDFNGDLAFNGAASSIDNVSQVNGLQADFSYQINQAHTLRSGLFVSDENTKSDRNTAVFDVDSDGDQTSDIARSIADLSNQNTRLYGVYLQDEWKAIDKLTINYGARFDALNSNITANQLSPRLGAVYELSKDTKFHLGYSKYFTPPPSELISSSKLAEFVGTSNESENLINDKVRPERTNYYDIGVNHKLTKHINIGLDGYYKDIKDLLDEGQFGSSLIFTPFNYQKAKVYGLEFSSDYNQDNFSAYFNFAWSDSKAKNVVSSQYLLGADEIDYIANNYVTPDHNQTYTASFGAAYKWYQTNYSLDAIYGNGLRRGFANQNRMPAYTQVNLGLSRDFTLPIINKFNARFSVINLFDEVYQLHDGSGIGIGAPQFGPRRGYYLTVSKSF
ncbi:MAG: TonB-dependent receptor [Pseudomonadota bacterium]